MITGVTKGFEYKMRLVYAHFPININIESERRGWWVVGGCVRAGRWSRAYVRHEVRRPRRHARAE